MQPKPKKRWLDAQIVLASLAMTFTLVLWNVFSGGRRQGNPQTGAGTIPNPQDPTATAVPTEAPTTLPTASGPTATIDPLTVHLPPIKIMLGGKAPPPVQVVVSGSGSQSSGSNHGGGSVSGSPASAPPPVTSTGSSKP